ncbi:hypothetical protein [Bradyrhizobium sp. AUGA SZCCT0182]|uniref:hypothetical protein n=1 Tax=Bradyrhizobium sp. AUGA SZCCT0182 TaxID=2807667 RepID=UPI001BA8D166|nr:hypothetical protein [Bradyrhizobium sp. AUGA SZCCT0182]MBR1231995.1 hypothetical protein [Bradyrhizobium sp. AUGA SZCCT0182]
MQQLARCSRRIWRGIHTLIFTGDFNGRSIATNRFNVHLLSDQCSTRRSNPGVNNLWLHSTWGKGPASHHSCFRISKGRKERRRFDEYSGDGLFNFYVSEQIRCAREGGFKNLDEFERQKRSDPSGGSVIKVEDCTVRVERRWQITNLDYSINLANKDSAARQFLERTKKQAFDIVAKWIKKKKMEKIGKAPSYENPKPR